MTYKSAEHVRLITTQLRAGVSELELRAVVSYCALNLGWKGDDKMGKYLQPSTLFGPKNIARYLDPARSYYAKQIERQARTGDLGVAPLVKPAEPAPEPALPSEPDAPEPDDTNDENYDADWNVIPLYSSEDA